MAGRSHVNWRLFRTLLSMGLSQGEAALLVGVKPATPYMKACRDRTFGTMVEQAMRTGRRALAASPTHFTTPHGDLLLDANFDPISRKLPSRLKPWVLAELAKHPFADLLV